MPPFTAYREGSDVAERVELGLIEPEAAAAEEETRRLMRERARSVSRNRRDDARRPQVHRTVLDRFRDGPARVVLVNLEDLWSETRPQNVPSTAGEDSPNWRRKARHSFEEFTQRPDVLGPLGALAEGISSASHDG